MPGVGPPPSDEDELERARRELDAVLDALRRARRASSSRETLDVEALRRALADALAQLGRVQARLARAEDE